MQTIENNASSDLHRYRNALRFSPELEDTFQGDFGERHSSGLRLFFILGLGLYLSFAILDYWALPFFYPIAWVLRVVFGVVTMILIFNVNTPFFKRNVLWLPSAWAFWVGLSILLMIYYSKPQEPAFVFYVFGLLLINVATYIPSSGDLLYPFLAGWAVTILYVLVGIFRQHLLLSHERILSFFIGSFFLVGMNVLCMIGGYMLVLSQRRDFLLRRIIEEQRATEERLREQADKLLLNILPASVAERLKRGELVADLHKEASILFADMVNFTPFSSRLELSRLVEILNEVFSHFDIMAGRYSLEKIKTTGDGYMVAAGLPIPRPDHAEVLIRLGLEMRDYFNHETFEGQKMGLRVGVNSGPIMAAVIGLQKFSYDLWGDTVNVASRMESHGQSGVVQITENTYELVKDKFICKPREQLEIKGKGKMKVWHVTGPK